MRFLGRGKKSLYYKKYRVVPSVNKFIILFTLGTANLCAILKTKSENFAPS